ncbi:tetratricopeptide repeat protein [Altericista sp. CCNU0014]|uniref:tetratricopeptide repeat protein n=1 Tax=Altericista sp. CCNU0014 TaxID=3082949 RepID=UPI00384F1C5C
MGTLGFILSIHHLFALGVQADPRTIHLGDAIAQSQADIPGPMDGYFLAIAVLGGWIASVCLHEFGHAIVAYWGGDVTVKDKGYLTLNPLKYTDIGYSLALPVVFLMLGGIALPGAAVYINHTLLRGRGWNSAVSAAGPLMTGIMAIALAIPLQFDWVDRDHWFWQALALLAFYQVAALCFNLCPVPSFDGFGILEPWLPRNLQAMARRWGRYGYLALFAILWTVPAANEGFWFLVRDISRNGLGIPLNLVEQGSAIFSDASKGIFVVLLLGALIFRKVWGGTFNQPSETANVEINLAAYDRLIEAGKATPEIWQHKGDMLQQLERYEEAIAAFDEALKIRPKDPDLWHSRAICLHQLQQYDRALIDYNRALEIQENSLIWANKAGVLMDLARFGEAVEAFSESINYNPSDLDNWRYRAWLLYQQQDYAASLSDFERVLKYQPNDVESLVGRGIALEKLEQFDEALKSYREAVRYSRKNSDIWQKIVTHLEQLNCSEEALKISEKAQQLFPKEATLWFQSGQIYFYQKEYEQAIAAYDQCLQLQYSEALVHYNKACCYALLSKSDLAIQSLTKSLNCGGRSLVAEAEDDPDLERLKPLEAFQALVNKAKSTET